MLNVAAITFNRDQIPILDAVSFELHAGEVLMVRGTNGCGKTTLLKLLAGLLPPQNDYRVSFDGEKYDPRDPIIQGQLSYVGHTLGIKDDLSCQENLQFLGRFFGRREARSPLGVLRSVGLDGYQYTHARRLSAGQRKRLALARLLLCPSRLWLLDEPYSNLDQDGITLVDRLLEQHVEKSGYVLMTSHGTFKPKVTNCRELILPGVIG